MRLSTPPRCSAWTHPPCSANLHRSTPRRERTDGRRKHSLRAVTNTAFCPYSNASSQTRTRRVACTMRRKAQWVRPPLGRRPRARARQGPRCVRSDGNYRGQQDARGAEAVGRAGVGCAGEGSEVDELEGGGVVAGHAGHLQRKSVAERWPTGHIGTYLRLYW